MTNAQKTTQFFAAIPSHTKDIILREVAAQYGVQTPEMFNELIDSDAEDFLDYVPAHIRSATSVLMQRHNLR